MAAVVFAPTVNPCDPLEDAHEPRVNRVQFGDAYAQRSRDGINSDLEKPTVKWEHLTRTEYQYIWGFMKARGGTESFSFLLPWDTSSITRTFICPRYSRVKHSVNDYDISCDWEEVVEA